MLFKQTFVLSSALALLSLPVIASANLDTFNHTNEDSSVKILKSGICSSKVPVFGTYTPANGQSSVTPLGVRAICAAGSGECMADIYMTRDCSGPVVANAKLNLGTITVTSINMISTKYKIDANGSVINIYYA